MVINRLLFILLLSFCVPCLSTAGVYRYSFEREISGIDSSGWKCIRIPDDVINKISPDFSDIRIYELYNNDSIEIPYFVNIPEDKAVEHSLNFEVINTSFDGTGYYYTFVLPQVKKVNTIFLDFEQKNYDCKVDISGSFDQKKWLGIARDLRILSIQNNSIHYIYNELRFPEVNYPYIKLNVKTTSALGLLGARVKIMTLEKAIYKRHEIANWASQEKEKLRQTVVNIQFGKKLPVSCVRLNIAGGRDFYRDFVIKYHAHDIKAPKGILEQYDVAYTGCLSSLEQHGYNFNTVITDKLLLVILNQDNPPLEIEGVFAEGPVCEIIAGFGKDKKYILTYGANIRRPEYDIVNFRNSIPEKLAVLALGEEQTIQQPRLIDNAGCQATKKYLLWGIIIAIMLTLSWFTLSMIRNSNEV